MVDKTGIKASQLFGWESEPKADRTSAKTSSGAVAERPAERGTPRVAPTDWESVRQPPNERDRSLSFVAVDWLQKFSAEDRPSNLCAMYPRVANRLALCWPDPVLRQHLLEGLLVDKRGKRQGFPAPVAQELIRLRRMP